MAAECLFHLGFYLPKLRLSRRDHVGVCVLVMEFADFGYEPHGFVEQRVPPVTPTVGVYLIEDPDGNAYEEDNRQPIQPRLRATAPNPRTRMPPALSLPKGRYSFMRALLLKSLPPR